MEKLRWSEFVQDFGEEITAISVFQRELCLYLSSPFWLMGLSKLKWHILSILPLLLISKFKPGFSFLCGRTLLVYTFSKFEIWIFLTFFCNFWPLLALNDLVTNFFEYSTSRDSFWCIICLLLVMLEIWPQLPVFTGNEIWPEIGPHFLNLAKNYIWKFQVPRSNFKK